MGGIGVQLGRNGRQVSRVLILGNPRVGFDTVDKPVPIKY